jgi:hypothetical protein
MLQNKLDSVIFKDIRLGYFSGAVMRENMFISLPFEIIKKGPRVCYLE